MRERDYLYTTPPRDTRRTSPRHSLPTIKVLAYNINNVFPYGNNVNYCIADVHHVKFDAIINLTFAVGSRVKTAPIIMKTNVFKEMYGILAECEYKPTIVTIVDGVRCNLCEAEVRALQVLVARTAQTSTKEASNISNSIEFEDYPDVKIGLDGRLTNPFDKGFYTVDNDCSIELIRLQSVLH